LNLQKVLSLEAIAEETTAQPYLKDQIKVFYKPNQTELGPKKLSPYNMLFKFNDISDSFESYLKKWFENSNNL
jgi:hypothetical protein